MADPQKQEYYRKNREKRLQYQRRYYLSNKSVFERKEELLKALDPDKWKKRRKKRKTYNKEYYLKNRDRIRERQRKRYLEREVSTGLRKSSE